MTTHRQTARRRWHAWWPYYLLAMPGLLYFATFHYLPMFEAKLAFENYRIIGPNTPAGLKHLNTLFSSPEFYTVLANTFVIAAMKLVFIFPIPVVLALMINEVRGNWLRRGIQSVLYLPHFLSWVVIAGISIAALSPTDGVFNEARGLFGLQPIAYMTDAGSIRWVLVFTEAWRSAGWDSLLYLAAILAIDPELYDAAELDGAGRWQKIRHITLPGIAPTIATLFILNAGMALNSGFDQIFNFSNDAVRDRIDIIDTFVYRTGLQSGEFALATAAGLCKGLVGMILVLCAHHASRYLTGKGVW